MKAQPKTKTPQLLTREDLMALLQISPTTLTSWIKEGLLPPPIVIGRRSTRWVAEDIERWLREHGINIKLKN